MIAPDKFYADINKLFDCIGKLDLKNFARTQKPLKVLSNAEQVDLLLFLIPIASNALKASGAVSKTMGMDGNHATLDGYKLAVHKEFFDIHLVFDK